MITDFLLCIGDVPESAAVVRYPVVDSKLHIGKNTLGEQLNHIPVTEPCLSASFILPGFVISQHRTDSKTD